MQFAGRAVGASCLLWLVVVSLPVSGEPIRQPPAGDSPAARPADVTDGGGREIVVVRFAESLLRPLLSAEVDVGSPVKLVVLGASTRGQATTTGHIWLDLKSPPEEDHGAFLVHFRGTTISKCVAQYGPASLHTTAATGFWATKNVTFEVGHGIGAAQTAISARTKTRLDAVCTRRCGVAGRIVRRVANRRFNQNLPAINRIGLANAKGRIGTSFDAALNERLSDLNELLATFRPLLEPYYESHREYPVTFFTTEDHAVICIGRDRAPSRLPSLPANEPDPSLVEVCIRTSVVQEQLDETGEPGQPTLRDILEQLQAATRPNGIPVTRAEIPMRFALAGDWLVIGAGDESTLRERVGPDQRK